MNRFFYLRRNWNTDKDVISKLIKYFKEINLTYQILLFPEGTNLTKSTKRRSDEYGNKNNFPLYDYVLHPRTTGFCFLSQEMMKAQHLDAIYDVTVMYPKTLPETELDLLKGNFPEEVHFFIKRYPIETIPKSESELQRWLRDLWDEKERGLEKAYEVGHFSHSKGV
ncbi:Lysocardiolipin acyltransferase 1, partial [Armadillidium vulgare]